MLGVPGWYTRKAPMTYLALAAFLLTFLTPMSASSTGAAQVQRGPAGDTVSSTLRTLPLGLTVAYIRLETLPTPLSSRPGSATWRWSQLEVLVAKARTAAGPLLLAA